MNVEIIPHRHVLQSLGVSGVEFDAALEISWDRLASTTPPKLPAAQDIPVHLRGRQHLLRDIAVIRVEFPGSFEGLEVTWRSGLIHGGTTQAQSCPTG